MGVTVIHLERSDGKSTSSMCRLWLTDMGARLQVDPFHEINMAHEQFSEVRAMFRDLELIIERRKHELSQLR